MAGPDGKNSWEAPFGGSSSLPDMGPSAPPPPPEVRVRTMKSDLESMAESGGGEPQFKSVKAPVVKDADGAARNAAAAAEASGAEGKSAISSGTVITIIIAVILLAAIGYFVYQLFFANPSMGSPSAANSNPPAQPPIAPREPPPTPSAAFVHRSFFKKPADQTLTLVIKTTASSAADLQTVSQRVRDLISGANATGTMLEINVKDTDGHDLEAQKIFDAADIAVLDQTLYAQHFVSDATFFVYRNHGGFWPGFVLSLKPGENWLFVKNDVARLEQSPKLTNFFLNSPGNSDARGFADTVIDGQPARILKYNSPAGTASFVYGWFHGYLILSTSEDGLKEAIAHL